MKNLNNESNCCKQNWFKKTGTFLLLKNFGGRLNRSLNWINVIKNTFLQGLQASTSCYKKDNITLQTNLLNPFLYDDIRLYKEKYEKKDHGLPNEFAKRLIYIILLQNIFFNLFFFRPSRGEFLIHPDW